MKLILAVDFDGTIVEHEYPEIGKPIKGSFRVLKRLKTIGHTLILWTCRYGEDLEKAIDLCKKNGLEFDHVNKNADIDFKTSNKIYADIYIDDRVFGSNIDWKEIEEKLINSKING